MRTVASSSTASLARAIAASSRNATAGTPGSRSTTTARPLDHRRERDQIEQRAARVRQVIHALRERADARDTVGGAPRPLRAAIEDFGRELADLERQLQDHGSAGHS